MFPFQQMAQVGTDWTIPEQFPPVWRIFTSLNVTKSDFVSEWQASFLVCFTSKENIKKKKRLCACWTFTIQSTQSLAYIYIYMCVHTCKHARGSDRAESCEVTGRCQSLLCIIATTHHPPSPWDSLLSGLVPTAEPQWGVLLREPWQHGGQTSSAEMCPKYNISSQIGAMILFI